MLVAPRKPRSPDGEWKTVLGAQFLFAPIDRPMLMRARRAAREASQIEGDEEAAGALIDPIAAIEEMGDAMSRALIMDGTKGWRDVGIAKLDDDGEPERDEEGEPIFDLLPFTADNLALVLSDPVTFEAIDNEYVVPFVLRERERAAPGNVFSASPNGTGGAETPGNGTATSPAKPSRAGGARSAPTSLRKPAPRRKKKSGGS